MAPEQHKLTALAAIPLALATAAPGTAGSILRGVEGHGWHGAGPAIFLIFAAASIGAWIGVTAPDTLEIARPVKQEGAQGAVWKRVSVIPHRTLTHWWPVWGCLLAVCLAGLPKSLWADAVGAPHAAAGLAAHAIGTGLTAFAIGGLLHLLGDLPNPSGIPRLLPFGRTVSLRWWRSDAAVANTIFAGALIVIGFVTTIALLPH